MEIEDIKKKVFKELGISSLNSGVFFGKWSKTLKHEVITSHSPIEGSKLADIRQATSDDYEKVIESATESFKQWAEIPAPKRGIIIKQIADELFRYKENLGFLISLEAGKTLTEGQGEVQEMIDIGYFATGLSRQIYGLTIASEREHHRLYEQWLPLGKIGVITSFNFPAAVWAWNAFLAAVLGNVSIWKPSSSSTLCAIATINIVNRVLEKNHIKPIFLLVSGSGSDIGNLMAGDARLPLISFTGSVRTGKKVAEHVGRRLGKSILELGGNNCAIVTDKCDIKVALKGVAFGALATAGQRCTTTRRLILHKDIYQHFIERIVKVFKSVKIGNPLEKDTLVGPLINENAVQNFLNTIRNVQKQGGNILTGGTIRNVPGFEGGHYVEPAIAEVTSDMDCVKEETFAPILYVMKYSRIEEALEMHNSVPQGLSSSIFTNDIREEEYFLSHKGSDCGIANVNTSTAGAEIGGAFGGEKDTGGGRESGSDAWKNYARRQTVTINYGNDVPLSQGVEFDID